MIDNRVRFYERKWRNKFVVVGKFLICFLLGNRKYIVMKLIIEG